MPRAKTTPPPPSRKDFEVEAYMEGCRLRVVFTGEIERSLEAGGLTLTELAKRLRRSVKYVTQVLDGEIAASVETYARFGWACGMRFTIARRSR